MAMGSGGGGASASAIEAGRAFVRIYSVDKDLVRGLERAQRMVQRFAAKMAGVGAGVAAAGGMILAPLTGFFREGISQAAELGDVASLFGTTAEQASKMAYAFEVTGNSTEDLKKALGKLSETADGRPLDEYFLDTVDALLAMDDAAERMAKARDIFGEKAAFKILDAGQDLRRLMGEAPLISAETMATAEEFEQQLKKIGAAGRAALVPLVNDILPVVTAFVNLVRENADLARVAAVAGAAMVAVGVAVLGVAGVASAAGFAFGGLAVAVKAVAGVVAFVLSPVGLFIAAVAALTYAFITLTDSGAKFGEWVVGTFESLKETATAAWQGIADAVRGGDLKLAFQIGVVGVKVVWADFTTWLTKTWGDFKSFFVDAWHDAVKLAKLSLVDLAEFMNATFSKKAMPWLAAAIAFAVPGAGAFVAPEVGGAFAAAGAGAGDARRNAIEKQAAAEQAARDAARKADEAGAKAEADALREELKRLQEQAAGMKKPKEPDRIGELAGQVAAAVRGTFSRGGPEFFFGGGGDGMKKVADNTKKSVDLLAEIRDALKDGLNNPLNFV